MSIACNSCGREKLSLFVPKSTKRYTKTLFGQNVVCLNAKPGGKLSNHWGFNVLISV